MRKLAAASLIVAAFAVSRPAAAFEVYAGLGATMEGVPSAQFKGLGLALEGGVDDILSDIGVGGQIDFIDWKPSLTAQFRYSILSIPFVRLIAGVGVGLEGFAAKLGASAGAFIAGRISLGMPYLGLKLGVDYGFADGDTSVGSLITLGACF